MTRILANGPEFPPLHTVIQIGRRIVARVVSATGSGIVTGKKSRQQEKLSLWEVAGELMREVDVAVFQGLRMKGWEESLEELRVRKAEQST